MRTARPAALAAAAVLTLLAPAAPAVAGIWSPIASGTASDITAVDDVRPDVLLYGTASGQLLKNGVVKGAFAGHAINDVAASPSGTTVLAAASNGLLLRSLDLGETWAPLPLPTTYNQPVPCATAGAGSVPVTGNLNAVAWASATVAYVVGDAQGVVLKTTNGGASWADAGRQPGGACRVNPNGNLLTDVATVPGSDVAWFVDNEFGATSVTTDALATAAPRRATASAVNCFDHRPRLALDADNPNRAFMVDRCDGPLQLGTTTDGGATWELSHHYLAGDPDALHGLNDVAIAGGSAMAVGNDGAILIANDPHDVFFQPADGALAATDWLSVSKRAGAHAVVGGAGGALIQTDAATQVPDLVPPGGTATGPAPTVDVPAGAAPEQKTAPPTPAPSPVRTTTVTVPGATISLGVPRACVAPGAKLRVTLTWKRQKRKGNRFVKVRRVDFSIGAQRVKVDRRAPFTQTLTVTASTKPGTAITVRARAYIKVSRGTSPTKSITATVKAC